MKGQHTGYICTRNLKLLGFWLRKNDAGHHHFFVHIVALVDDLMADLQLAFKFKPI